MEEQTKTFVGARSAQEIQQTNPVEQIRQPTDRLFIFIFPLFMLLWLGIGIAALCADQADHDSARQLAEFKIFINAPFSSFRFGHIIAFIIPLILSTGFILLSLFLNKKCTKFFVYLGIGIYILSTISVCFNFIFGSTMDSYDENKINISPPIKIFLLYVNSISRTWVLLKAVFMIASVISFFKVDQNEIRNVVKDFCRVILASPLMILFLGFITILGFAIFLFTVNAVVTDALSDRNGFHMFFDILILVLGCICGLSFIYNFALMVISEYTVNYYWMKGDKPAVGQSVSQISKNHLGTIMFSCTPYVPFICAIVQAVKHTRSPRNNENFFFYIASKIFLVLNIEYFALIVSSIYGTGFVKSLKKTLDIVLRRCLFYLAASGVIEAIIGIIATIVFILTAIAFVITVGVAGSSQERTSEISENHDNKKIDVDTAMYIASFLYGFLIPLVTFAVFMYFSAKALLINKIIMFNKEEQYNEGKTDILNRL